MALARRSEPGSRLTFKVLVDRYGIQPIGDDGKADVAAVMASA